MSPAAESPEREAVQVGVGSGFYSAEPVQTRAEPEDVESGSSPGKGVWPDKGSWARAQD